MKKATKKTAKPERKILVTGEITKDPILSPIFDKMLYHEHKQLSKFAETIQYWSARQITNEPPRAPYEHEFWDQWFNELPRFAERLTEGGPLVELMLAVLERIATNSPHMDEGEYRYWCRWLQNPRSDRLTVSDTILTKSVDRFLSETGQNPIVRFGVVPSPIPEEPSDEFAHAGVSVLHAAHRKRESVRSEEPPQVVERETDAWAVHCRVQLENKATHRDVANTWLATHPDEPKKIEQLMNASKYQAKKLAKLQAKQQKRK